MRIRHFLNAPQCITLALSFALLAGPAAAQTQTPAPRPMVNIDIVGIKPGMPAHDAIVALKADNPHLALTPASYKFEGFMNPLIPFIEGNDTPATMNAQVQHASEQVQILFTTPPGQEVVWSVNRFYSFPTSERPSLQTIIDALRKKYGPESVPPGPPSTSQNLIWVFDDQGKPVGARGAQLSTICASTLGIYTGSDAKTAINVDIHSPRAWPPECTSLIIVRAVVGAVQIASGNQFAATSMNVSFHDGGRYRSSLEATRGVILNAMNARQQKQADEVNKRTAPKL